MEADGELVDFQDYHAVLLRQRAAAPELGRLAKRLMDQTAGKRPEPWVAASLHADLRGDKERALAFVDKATAVDPAHVLTYHVKGTYVRACVCVRVCVCVRGYARDAIPHASNPLPPFHHST
jgi:hypothetical protein